MLAVFRLVLSESLALFSWFDHHWRYDCHSKRKSRCHRPDGNLSRNPRMSEECDFYRDPKVTWVYVAWREKGLRVCMIAAYSNTRDRFFLGVRKGRKVKMAPRVPPVSWVTRAIAVIRVHKGILFHRARFGSKSHFSSKGRKVRWARSVPSVSLVSKVLKEIRWASSFWRALIRIAPSLFLDLLGRTWTERWQGYSRNPRHSSTVVFRRTEPEIRPPGDDVFS